MMSFADSVSAFTATDVPELVAGFIFGLTTHNDLEEILACGADLSSIGKEIELGIADIKEGGWDEDV